MAFFLRNKNGYRVLSAETPEALHKAALAAGYIYVGEGCYETRFLGIAVVLLNDCDGADGSVEEQQLCDFYDLLDEE